MRNDCPNCSTVYAVTPQDVGKRIICKQCQTALVIAEDGFRIDLSVPAAVPPKSKPATVENEGDDTDAEPNLSKKEKGKADKSKNAEIERAKAFYQKYVDLPTILFGIGAFFVLTFLFMPMVGKAKLDRRQGLLAEEKHDLDREIRVLREKPGNDEKIKKLEEAWSKRSPVLEAEVKYAEISNQRSGYLDKYGMLFGFVLLMVGSLGMVRADTHLVKRIFGAAVLGLQLLLVFSSILGGCRGLPGA